jgi:chemotaxis protein CheD
MVITALNQEHSMHQTLPGFESIKRYWDKTNAAVAAKILPGEYYVTTRDELITTVLGSCVSACIRDRIFGIGGMNHFMLPVDNGSDCVMDKCTVPSAAARYGNVAMEYLINDILKHGGTRENLEVKIFGGGRILANMTNIGRCNIEFVLDYLHTEGIEISAQNLGDIYPRKIIFNPITGNVRLRKLRSMHNNTVIDREQTYRQNLAEKPVEGEIDLF